ncbi:uncharacterized protein [Watersipora subatra]|uniref:uncharacterized protein n=1 Tax=Watersipora subatra TaxID=2589382 RepID=UPI00355B4747
MTPSTVNNQLTYFEGYPVQSVSDNDVNMKKEKMDNLDNALKSYKTGKAYSYFFNDWIQEVFFYDIRDTDACYLKSTCTPSQRVNDIPHSQWIKVLKSSGVVQSAFCSCVAGLSQTCNHIAALMFKIESAFRLDTLGHLYFASGKEKSIKKSTTSRVKFGETLNEPGVTCHFKDFVESLRSAINSLTKCVLSDQQISDIEVFTRGQSENENWRRLKRGRVTASNFYKIHTKMESLKCGPSTDCSKLVESIINPSKWLHLSQILEGAKIEPLALENLKLLLLQEGRKNVKINSCGLFIHNKLQFIRASTDGICSSDCCETRLVEIKCPARDVNCLPYLHIVNGAARLKHKSAVKVCIMARFRDK